jgi:uncharacterized protein with von Willebrand factor type A (vWA) domain
MTRSFVLFFCLLGAVSSADVSAAPTEVVTSPKGKIRPGNHRPVYKRYGHHGLFDQGFRSMFRRKGPSRLTVYMRKSRRGTL